KSFAIGSLAAIIRPAKADKVRLNSCRESASIAANKYDNIVADVDIMLHYCSICFRVNRCAG
ncbi:MAG: hypothetical protein U1C55_11460, partial [Smithellaceae bacterium]|nr:hypothetical protein [Smithellaceae bacterium]